MFLSDENELEALQKEKLELEQRHHATLNELKECKAELEKAVHRYNKLIDITSIALEKTQKSDTSKEESQEEK